MPFLESLHPINPAHTHISSVPFYIVKSQLSLRKTIYIFPQTVLSKASLNNLSRNLKKTHTNLKEKGTLCPKSSNSHLAQQYHRQKFSENSRLTPQNCRMQTTLWTIDFTALQEDLPSATKIIILLKLAADTYYFHDQR